MPTVIDTGTQFTSKFWSTAAQMLGTKLHHTAAYHPQAYCQVECFRRHRKSSSKVRRTGPDWMDELSSVLLVMRTASKEDLAILSAELVHGYPLTVQEDYIPAAQGQEPATTPMPLHEKVGKLTLMPTSRHGVKVRPH